MDRQLTTKANNEIQSIQTKLNIINQQIDMLNNERNSNPSLYRPLQATINKLITKHYGLETKQSCIKDEGISTTERTALLRESKTYTTILSERGLGYTSYSKIGYSKTINQHTMVNLTRYNNFMKNVQGCASLAGKTELNYHRPLSKEEYQEYFSQNKRTITTFFPIKETQTVPIDIRSII